MKAGQASQTATWVCMARAMAHERTIAQFSDPTAYALLPDEARPRVDRIRANAPPSSIRDRISRNLLEGRIGMMVVRTVEIDESIRAVPHPQVVILGAGLDGRAWRMPELRDSIVFEVDHPDSQQAKRQRVATLAQTAREVRFVAVDFTRDSLDDLLAAAGHDATRPTTWIWEGVIMYLTREAIDATLAVVSRRSARGSRLVVAYLQPALTVRLVGLLVRRAGEPFRSTFKPHAMRQLLAAHGFTVGRDETVPAIAAALSQELAHQTRMVGHLRVATADRG